MCLSKHTAQGVPAMLLETERIELLICASRSTTALTVIHPPPLGSRRNGLFLWGAHVATQLLA